MSDDAKANTDAPKAGDPPPPPPPNSAPKAADVDKSSDTSTAKGDSTAALGGQVHPDTMLNEADGNRTLMHPVVDPGPYVIPGSVEVKVPDRSKGEHRVGDVNEGVTVNMRTSTGHSMGFGKHDGEMVNEAELPADVFVSGAASDVYNKEQGKSLTDMAAQKAGDPKEVAITRE